MTNDDDHPDESAHTDTVDQAEAREQAEDQAITPEPAAQPPRRRWAAIRRRSHQHPVALPISAGVAGLLLGAGVTATMFTAYLPDGQASTAALRAMPPARVEQAPAPRTWPGPLPPRGARALDDPPPPPPPGAPSAPGWGPPPPPPFGGPPPPGWGPPPPGWGPPPPFRGPPPPPGWGPPPPPPPGPWGPPPPPGPPEPWGPPPPPGPPD